MADNFILVEGAREHNLTNITVRILRGSLCVVTGLRDRSGPRNCSDVPFLVASTHRPPFKA